MPTINPPCSSCLRPVRVSLCVVMLQPSENVLLRSPLRKVYISVPSLVEKKGPRTNSGAFSIQSKCASQNSKRTANSISRAPSEPVVGPAVDVRFPNVPGLVGSMESEESAKLTLLKML